MKQLISGKPTENYYDPRPNLLNDHRRDHTDEIIVMPAGIFTGISCKYRLLVYSVEHTKTHGGVPEYEEGFRTKLEALTAGRKIARQRNFPLYWID